MFAGMKLTSIIVNICEGYICEGYLYCTDYCPKKIMILMIPQVKSLSIHVQTFLCRVLLLLAFSLLNFV